MATLTEIRRLTAAGRTIATGHQIEPKTAIELVRIFDLIDLEVIGLAGNIQTITHRRRRTWRGLWRRNQDS